MHGIKKVQAIMKNILHRLVVLSRLRLVPKLMILHGIATMILIMAAMKSHAFQAADASRYTVKFDGAAEEQIFDATSDDSGNLYLVGAYSSVSDARIAVYANSNGQNPARVLVDSHALPASQGQTDLVVVKLDASGAVAWVITLGESGSDAATGVAFDRVNQRVFVTGYITGSMGDGAYSATQAAGIELQSTTNLFIAALSSDFGTIDYFEAMPLLRSGTTETLTQVNITTGDTRADSSSQLHGQSIAISHNATPTADGAINIYIKGQMHPVAQSGARLGVNVGGSSPTFDATANAGSWAFVTKVEFRENPVAPVTRFNWKWMSPVSSQRSASNFSTITQLAVDPDLGLNSPVYVSGYWSGAIAAGVQTSRTAEGSTSGFVGSMQATNGQTNYLASVGGDSAVNALVVDDNGNLIVAGKIARVSEAAANVNLRSANLTSGPTLTVTPAWDTYPKSSPRYKHRALVAKLSKQGNWQWATLMGGRYSSALDLEKGNDGAFYLTGGLGKHSTMNGLALDLSGLSLGELNVNNTITNVSFPQKLADYALASPTATTVDEVFSQAWHDATLTCPVGSTLINGRCYSSCNANYVATGDRCIRQANSYTTATNGSCGGGYSLINSYCYDSCDPDTPWLWDNTQCWDGEFNYPRERYCPGSESGGLCYPACNAGYTRSGNTCSISYHEYARPSTAATAGCMSSNGCRISVANSSIKVELLRNGTVFGQTLFDTKRRGKGDHTSPAYVSLMNYLDTIVTPNPKMLGALSASQPNTDILWNDQWSLRFVHDGAPDAANYQLSGTWDITLHLADNRTHQTIANLSNLQVNGSTGSVVVNLPFPAGFVEPELIPDSFAFVARFRDNGAAATFDWMRMSDEQDTHGALLHFSALQTLYTFGGRGHFPNMSAALEDDAYYATAVAGDTSDADRLMSRGTVMNVMNPSSGQLLTEFLNYFSYRVGDRIDPPLGGYSTLALAPLRQTVPTGLADPGINTNGMPRNKPLLSAPSTAALYAAAPLSHALIYWPTQEAIAAIHQPRIGRAIKVRWPTIAEGLQEYIYSTDSTFSLLPHEMNTSGTNNVFHWVQYAETTEPENAGQQTLAPGTAVTTGLQYNVDSKVLTTSANRLATLVFFDGSDPNEGEPRLLAVQSYRWTQRSQADVPATIGNTLSPPAISNASPAAYVMTSLARYDATPAVYNRSTRSGQIIPVNRNGSADNEKLVVAWYQQGTHGRQWPAQTIHYTPDWPQGDQIVIASQLGTLTPGVNGEAPSSQGLEVTVNQPTLYVQNNRALPGFNPNEEHAVPYQPSGSAYMRYFALRSDLNNRPQGVSTSEPYVLVRYRDPLENRWKYRIWQVHAFNSQYPQFALNPAIAGQPVVAPYPLSVLAGLASLSTSGHGDGFWLDKNGQVWSRADSEINVDYHYRLQPDFWHDPNGDGVHDAGANGDVAWPRTSAGATVTLTYASTWPDNVPEIAIGDTLLHARNGLPDVAGMQSVTVVYDENDPFTLDQPASATRAANATVRLFEFDNAVSVAMPASVTDVEFTGTLLTLHANPSTSSATLKARQDASSGHYYFPGLPSDLRYRLRFNPQLGAHGEFYFQGGVFNAETAQPAQAGDANMLLTSIMTAKERDALKRLDNADGFANEVDETTSVLDTLMDSLYVRTRNPQNIDMDNANGADNAILAGFEEITDNQLQHRVVQGVPVLTTAFARAPGYVVLADNVSAASSDPVNMSVIRVVAPKADGSLHVVRNADNALDPRLIVRQSLDFGGRADALEFEWWWHPDVEGEPAVNIDSQSGEPQGAQWQKLTTATGLNALTLSSGLPVLADGWVIGRYRGLYDNAWSGFTGQPGTDPGQVRPVYSSGWVRRVLEGVNAFEQRYTQFHDTQANSYTSMLVQAGARYEGDVALSAENNNLNAVGLIELYQTVLNVAAELSIDANNPITEEIAINKQLLLAASRIADLYLLLGNEAYSDAMDPTVGIQTHDGSTGYLAPTLFAFSEQLPSLLDEELALLRGVDQRRAAPLYNHMPWNFSSGNEGEPTYVQVYGISDANGNGAIDEARTLYPQGHGDAWGHYLMATKQYYALARHPNYDWQPVTDTTSIAGVPVQVDYKDEERFARAAAAKARTGARIVDLTFRKHYSHAPAGQWQGYKDSNPQRAWGMDEWARRAGQAAVLDWALGNALLPYEDTTATAGVDKIDRQTVTSLAALPAALSEIDALVANADSGNNPFGLASDAISFDIDPAALSEGQSHFEQIYERAVKASTNALRLFDYANDLTQQIRVGQLDTTALQRQISAQEQDYRSRLIELLGYPHAGEIGAGKLYPTGYNGPDIYHYMYVDRSLGALPASQTSSFQVNYDPKHRNFLFPADVENLDATAQARYVNVSALAQLTVNYPYVEKTDYAFVAPTEWGSRRAPGRIQSQLGEMQLIQARINTAHAAHATLHGKITDQIELIQDLYGIYGDQINVFDAASNKFLTANSIAVTSKTMGEIMEKSGGAIYAMFQAAKEAPPKSIGLAWDAFSPLRSALAYIGAAAKVSTFVAASGVVRGVQIPSQIIADQTIFETRLEVAKGGYQADVAKQLTVLEGLLRDELVLRSQLVELQQELDNAAGVYEQLLGQALRLMEEREMFRRDIASRTLDERYQDMTYRVFRNDALQKYRAGFDLAARYTYLAAKAFDYETGLLSDEEATHQQFYEDLIRQRTLGYFAGGTTPVAGVEGLSSPLARMNAAFSAVKSNYGLYTPLNESLVFSLRQEAFRIGPVASENSQLAWQQALHDGQVSDLWQVPEFRRYCRPPTASEQVPIPGIVLRFNTMIDFGRNLFGWPLGAGDHAYDSSRAATKFHGVGLHFDGYPSDQLSATPRAYLVPAGADVLRSPTRNGALRQYAVLDQSIPAPNDLVPGDTSFAAVDWIPEQDDVSEPWTQVRRFSQLPVSSSSVLNANQVTTDTRLIGRSVWNTDWLLIIPGSNLLANGEEGLRRLINGNPAMPGSHGITDIRLYFDTYSTSGE